MTINLTDPSNHPANGPLTVERITRVRDELQRTMFYASGGVMDYIVVDAIKALEELLVRRGGEPEVLPCPVFLEPGLRFGKGVKTKFLFDALKRRAEYYAELDAMTPEQRAEHDAGVAEFKAMLGGGFRDLSQPVDPQIAEYEKIMQQAIPDGWVLVPIELTREMRAAWDLAPNTDDDDHDMQAAYRAMIAAAPQEVK